MSNILPRTVLHFDPELIDADLPDVSAFRFPENEGIRKTYLCGHSLGLQPDQAERYTDEVMKQWATLGVEGHFEGNIPWIHYLDDMHRMMAKLVNAKAHEVVIMNTLTTNIHILLSGFYQPSGHRKKILMEQPAFPSDLYAIKSHLQTRGYSDKDIIYWNPDITGSFNEEVLKELIVEHHEEIALIFISGVHYLNGQLFDLRTVGETAARYNLMFGVDLAHAVGNVELSLHDWGVDFACWCTYKYLNGGPGSLGACFIHEKHHTMHHHFQGWWGNSLSNRFEMHSEFTPDSGAWSWQMSNPPILALASLRASLEIFDRYGMSRLRSQSRILCAYMYTELEKLSPGVFTITTPPNAEKRGAMLCLYFENNATTIFDALSQHHVIVDYRRPGTIRVAAHPLYNSFDDCYRFISVLREAIRASI
ncbi:MAG: kynureninase [Saprospiraceae bacterium]|nr:kynureninase [Saprospiraceae bacterium]